MTIQKQLAAEGLGTALLAAMAIGTSIMSQRLGSEPAAALMSSALACGLGVFALLSCFGGISGAHFNPALSLSESWRGRLSARIAAAYIAVQCMGAFAGVAAAHFMFDAPLFEAAGIARSDSGQWASEFIATFGLIGVCIGSARQRSGIATFAVSSYVIAAFWFTPSSAFMNPAITLAKAATASPAGIRLSDVPGFVLSQLCGGMAATWVFGWLYPAPRARTGTRAASLPSLMAVADPVAGAVADALPESR
jgi:glycerol uptake facilitator-like aquaporin